MTINRFSQSVAQLWVSFHVMTTLYLGLDARKPVGWFANNKGTDQSAHPRSLISAFVIHFLESIISKLASSEI